MGSFLEKYNDRKSLTEFKTGKKLVRSKNRLEPCKIKGVSFRSNKKNGLNPAILRVACVRSLFKLRYSVMI